MGGERVLRGEGLLLVMLLVGCASAAPSTRRPDATYEPMEMDAVADAMGCAAAIATTTPGFTVQRSPRSAALIYTWTSRDAGRVVTRENLLFAGFTMNDGRFRPTLMVNWQGQGMPRARPSIELLRVRQMVEKQCFQHISEATAPRVVAVGIPQRP